MEKPAAESSMSSLNKFWGLKALGKLLEPEQDCFGDSMLWSMSLLTRLISVHKSDG